MGVLTKKKYSELKAAIEEKMLSHADSSPQFHQKLVEDALAAICEVYKYDPVKGSYTPEHGKKNFERIKKMAQEAGVSTYVISGSKKNYQKKKALKETIQL